MLLENYPRQQVDFHRNFVSMEGGHFSIQMSSIAANPVLKTGGEVSRMRIRTDKKGFVRCRIDLSGIVMTSSTVYLTLYPDRQRGDRDGPFAPGRPGRYARRRHRAGGRRRGAQEHIDLLTLRAVPLRATPPGNRLRFRLAEKSRSLRLPAPDSTFGHDDTDEAAQT